MLEFLALPSLSAGARVLVQDVLGPLTKAAAEDFYKDFLKQSVSEATALQAPKALQRAIAQSIKDFLVLFGDELETCGLNSALVNHEFAEPLRRLTKDAEVRAFLGQAFSTEVKRLDPDFLAGRWQDSPGSHLPEEFDWAQLTKTYVRRVEGLIRSDAELNRQLELTYLLKNGLRLIPDKLYLFPNKLQLVYSRPPMVILGRLTKSKVQRSQALVG